MSADELIDRQRKEFENPTEWKRRRAFLQLNFNGLPFDRLVCLSHCYVNTSIHGAVYPARVMEEVEQYSSSIDSYLSNGRGSDAGQPSGGGGDHGTAVARGHKRAVANAGNGTAKPPPWKQQRLAGTSAAGQRPRPLDLDFQLQAAAAAAKEAAEEEEEAGEVSLPADFFDDNAAGGPGEFFLREIETDDGATSSSSSTAAAANPANVLKCSTDFCRRTLDYAFEDAVGGSVRCRLLLDGRPVAVDSAATKAAAKAAVSARVLAALRSRCWTLVVRSDQAFIRAQADAGVARPAAAAAAQQEEEQQLGSDNVGHRLLRGMGWSGSGGLGKRLDGRAEPPAAGDVRIVSRAGLGAADAAAATAAAGAAFQSAVGRILRDFQQDPVDRDDLFFAADFTNEERRHVHSQCLRLGLASRSYGGSDGARCLVVSRKRTARQLVDFVRRNGGSTGRYRLVEPGVGVVDSDTDAAASSLRQPADGSSTVGRIMRA